MDTHASSRLAMTGEAFASVIVTTASTLSCGLRRLAAAVAGGLIRHPRMVRAVGQAGQRLAAAKKEFRARGITDRPMAGRLAQLQQRKPLAQRHDIVEGDRI